MTATELYDARHGNHSTALIYILTTVWYPGNELPDNGTIHQFNILSWFITHNLTPLNISNC